MGLRLCFFSKEQTTTDLNSAGTILEEREKLKRHTRCGKRVGRSTGIRWGGNWVFQDEQIRESTSSAVVSKKKLSGVGNRGGGMNERVHKNR